MRRHEDSEQRRVLDPCLELPGQLGGAVDAFVGTLGLVQKNRNPFELTRPCEFGPEVVGEGLRPALSLGVVSSRERTVAVADE